MECEYSFQCLGEKAEYACVAPENHQECAQYRDFSVKAKQRDIKSSYLRTMVEGIGRAQKAARADDLALQYNARAMDFVMKKLGV
jgi:hypothetical protein